MSEERLAQWQAREAELRQLKRNVGLASPTEFSGLPALEMFRAMLAGRSPRPAMGDTLDFLLVEVDAGRAVFQGRPHARFYNPMGSVHGGWYAALLDSAVGCAVHSGLPAGRAYSTLELKVNMVRALSDRVPLVRAEGQVIHAGRQVATAEGRLYDAAGTLYGHASTTCLIFDLKPAG